MAFFAVAAFGFFKPAAAHTFNLWRPACHTVTLTEVQGPFDGIYGSFVSSKVEKTVKNTACKALNEWTLLTLPSNIDIETTRQANPGITFSKTLLGLAIKTKQDPGTTRNLIVVSKRPMRVGQPYLSQGGIILTAGLLQALPGPSVAFGPSRSVIDPNDNALTVENANGFTANRFAIGPTSQVETTVYAGNGATEEGDFVPKLQAVQAADFGEYLPPLALVSDPESAELTGAVEMDAEDKAYAFYSRSSADLFASPRLHMVALDADGNVGKPVEIFPDDDETVAQLFLGTAIDGQGNLHVAVNRLGTDPDGAPNTSILYSRSADGGATWSAPTVFDSQYGDAIYPSVAASADGAKVMVSYFGTNSNFGGADSEIRVATSNDGGASFPSNVQVLHRTESATTNFPPFTKLAIGGGKAYLSGTDELTQDEFGDIFVVSSEDGVTWSGQAVANQQSTNLQSPIANMGVGPNGEVDAFWHSDPDGDGNPDVLNHARSVDGGATFSASQVLATGGTLTALTRGIRYDSDGRIHLQYSLADFGGFAEPGAVYEIIGE